MLTSLTDGTFKSGWTRHLKPTLRLLCGIRCGDSGRNRGGGSLIQTLVVFAVGSALFMLMLKHMLYGRRMQPMLMLFGLVGMCILLALKDRYWLMIPLGYSSASIAKLFGYSRIDPSEFAILAVTGFYLLHMALRQRRLDLLSPHAAFVWLYALWVLIAFMLNPAGINAFGSSTIGGRYYFRILLATLSFFVLSNQRISEQDAKWATRVIIGIFLLSIPFIAYFTLASPTASTSASGVHYSRLQEFSASSFVLASFLFATYSTEGILTFSHPWRLIAYLALVVLGPISGKRSTTVLLAALPAIDMLFRRGKRVAVFIWLGSIVIVAFALVQISHTEIELPQSIQRAVAYLPGEWDENVVRQTQGLFRRELRAIAAKQVQSAPLLGRKGFSLDRGEILSLYGQQAGHAQFIEANAISGNWHTTWLGIAADFGIPAAFFWAGFWVQALFAVYSVLRSPFAHRHQKTLACVYGYAVVAAIARSLTSGHSAELPYGQWWWYGIVIGMLCDIHARRKEDAPALDTSPRPMSAPMHPDF